MSMKNYKTFKALGVFLCYPRKDWIEYCENLANLIVDENVIGKQNGQQILQLAQTFAHDDIFVLQEDYVDTFDRVRSLSLHLFEHVHGDSRDRGQAMIDLSDRYQEQKLSLKPGELPDYLPIFLEYLSSLDAEIALEELNDVAHILMAIGTKLKERASPYHIIFDALLNVVGQSIGEVKFVNPEISFEEMDNDWEEKQIEFLGAQAPDGGSTSTSCGTCPSSIKTNCNSNGAIQ